MGLGPIIERIILQWPQELLLTLLIQNAKYFSTWFSRWKQKNVFAVIMW